MNPDPAGPFVPVDPGHRAMLTPRVDLGEALRVLRRRYKIVLATVGLTLAVIALILFQVTPRYTAEAVIMLDTRKTQVADIQSVVSGLTADSAIIRSEVQVLGSRALAAKVVDKLGLDMNPLLVDLTDDEEEQFASADRAAENADQADSASGGLLAFFGLGKTAEQRAAEARARGETRRQTAIQNLARGLRVVNDGRSYVIRVSFESEDKELAAQVANAVADQYLVDQLEAKFEATRRANEWLNERIEELRVKVRDSEQAVQRYRQENQIVESKGTSINQQQLSELNTQLILTRSDRAQKEAQYRQLRNLLQSGENVEASSEVLSSPLIQRLREQETEVLRKEAELSERYGDRHPTMINLRAEIRDLRRKIGEEVNKVARSLANEVEVVRTRERTLSESLRELERDASGISMAEVQLRELEREAAANRALFENFLTRFKETSTQQDILTPDARVISAAEVPLKPSYPRKSFTLALAFFFSLIGGVALIFILERLDQGVRTPQQLQDLTGVPGLGVLPSVAGRGEDDAAPHDEILTNVTSKYSEAVRSIMTSLRLFTSGGDRSVVVLLSSSVPEEGKTTLAVSIARSAARTGRRAILVDCDLRRSAVAKLVGLPTASGVADIVRGDAGLDQAIMKDPRSELDIIVSKGGVKDPQKILGSAEFGQFLATLRGRYEIIVIDSPPVLAVSDTLVIAPMADATLFLVRWEKTPRPVAVGAINQFKSHGIALRGVIVSRVDADRHALYGYGDHGYYYGRYGDYYET